MTSLNYFGLNSPKTNQLDKTIHHYIKHKEAYSRSWRIVLPVFMVAVTLFSGLKYFNNIVMKFAAVSTEPRE